MEETVESFFNMLSSITIFSLVVISYWSAQKHKQTMKAVNRLFDTVRDNHEAQTKLWEKHMDLHLRYRVVRNDEEQEKT